MEEQNIDIPASPDMVEQIVKTTAETVQQLLTLESLQKIGTNIVPSGSAFRLASGAVYLNVQNTGTYGKPTARDLRLLSNKNTMAGILSLPRVQFSGMPKLPSLRRLNKSESRRDLIRTHGRKAYRMMRDAQRNSSQVGDLSSQSVPAAG